MKNQKFLLAAFAATAVMSCTSSEDEVMNGNEPVAVKFTAGNPASVNTRVTDASWAAGDSIGIYMVNETPGTLADGNIAENVDNIRYNSTGGSGAVSFEDNGTKIFYPVSGNVKFVAYYPYTKSITGDYKYNFCVASQSSQSAIDVLYAPADATYGKNSNTPVKLPFKHQLVKLVFNISNGEGVTASLSGLAVEIDGQSPDGTLDLTDGTVTASGTAQDISALYTITNGSAATYEAIVLPAENAGKMLSFDNGTDAPFTAAIPHGEWKAGNKYTYTVTLQKSEADITGEITEWTTNTGEVTAN
ncbi:MAG: fimbrillin family protein [Bacteroidales bacterium]|jgi:hypothetical protein|nr:fimbrillin family protein [Bacteroidales bacterium]